MSNYHSVYVLGYGEIVPVCENDLKIFQMIVENINKTGKLKCPICKEDIKHRKRQHLEWHLSKKYYKCECNSNRFSENQLYNSFIRHQKKVHGEKYPNRHMQCALSVRSTTDFSAALYNRDLLGDRMRELQRQIEGEQINRRQTNQTALITPSPFVASPQPTQPDVVMGPAVAVGYPYYHNGDYDSLLSQRMLELQCQIEGEQITNQAATSLNSRVN
jgi:hypothetical protein